MQEQQIRRVSVSDKVPVTEHPLAMNQQPQEPQVIHQTPDPLNSSSRNTTAATLNDLESDDPLPSGYGEVSKDCSQKDLEGWSEVLAEWRLNPNVRPKQLPDLVRKGIPEALRGEVWQMLANCSHDEELIAKYADVVTKDCPVDVHVRRDIGRTFPAHEFFRETGSLGQEALYRVLKAYAVHDEEVGYCQGFSFIAAALLLHMPEEQAFCVLVKIMNDYGLRYTPKDGFENLCLRFYQLDRFIEDQLPDLFKHFKEQHVETHMYASQWFLTLFTAKFPLYVVFYIMDIYLLDGTPALFQVAISLLQLSKEELLRLDFEGILKYFRIQMPKNYRSDENARILLQLAISRKVRSQMNAYEKAYNALREQDKAKGDAIRLMRKENKRLVYSNMRLEQENDDLARELISSKIALRRQLDQCEDRIDALVKENFAATSYSRDLEEDHKRHLEEINQLKDVCRREIEKFEREICRNTGIIADYKQICKQLSERLEKAETKHQQSVDQIMQAIRDCESCHEQVTQLRSSGDQVANGGVNGDSESSNGGMRKKSSDGSCTIASGDGESEMETRVRELELELAQTKLALVEAECINQDLVHDLNTAQNALQASKSKTWIHKTLTTIREAKHAATQKRDAAANKFFTRENSREFS
jgi:hypothetical protein